MMKKILFILTLCACLLPLSAAKKQTVVFPDGSPVDDWFLKVELRSPESLGRIYNIADYGAVSSTEKVQTELIQSVIERAAKSGGVVMIPEGIYKSGALHFRQGTHLYLAKGAVLLGSESIFDFPLCQTRIEGEICRYFPALVNAEDLDGFTICGEGTIDGNGSDYWRAFRLRRQWNPQCTNKDEMRPRLLYLARCTNVQVSGVSLQNSPFWTCHCYKSDHVQLIGLRLFSPVRPIASASADGIDMDACSNFLIRGCRFTVNDDAVCLKGGKGPWADRDTTNGPCRNILVEDCHFDNTTGSCLTCGSESIHVRNVLMRNCQVDGASHLLLLKLRPDTPQLYEYITVENVKGTCRRLFEAGSWRQFFNLKDRPDIPKSYASHITLRQLDIDCQRFVNTRRNDEEYELSDFVFQDIKVWADDVQNHQEAFHSVSFDKVEAAEKPKTK